MAHGRVNVKEDIRQLESVAGRAGSDTIRLWEGYREQAYLWRALFLIQLPVTGISIFAAIVFFFFADTIIEVPERPQPGSYSVKQLPDAQFVEAAQQVVNLIASYTPHTAPQQFSAARKFLWEPALSEFEKHMMGPELRLIRETSRSQLFFVNRSLVKVERFPERDLVRVRLPGRRMKFIGGSRSDDEISYVVEMTTIPRTIYNEYGIVVTNMRLRSVSEQQLKAEDRREQRRR